MSDYLWWRDGVIYQIYPRSFMDSNGDGVGDLPGITARLDYVADLGVDAIWLSPINTSPMYDFGYDISDYEAIDPVFGTQADFEALLAEAHRRGLKVMLDLVINHTSHLHSWFVESRSSRDNPKADWYIWRDKPANGKLPNNWMSAFGGPAWEWDPTRRQYYYHMFLKEQPDLNWRNPEVRAAVMSMIRRWLDRGVDGFRLDVVNGYFKDAEFRDNPARFEPNLFAHPWLRHNHVYDRDQPELHDAYREFRALLDSYPERGSVGEVIPGDLRVTASYLGASADELHMAFNLGEPQLPWRPRAFQKTLMEWEAAIPPGAWPCHVLSNHDVTRHITRFGGGPHAAARAKVAAGLLLTLRGTPFLYMGEEIAMPSPHIARKDIVDPPGKRYWPFYTGRDNARTPMQWDSTPQAGFTSGKPWLPVGPSYRRVNASAQKDDPNSVLNFYRELLRLRRASPALRSGSFRPMIKRPVEALAYLRQTPEQTMLVLLNFFAWSVSLEFSSPLPAARWRIRLNNSGADGERTIEKLVSLAPYEVVVLEALG
jgi:alpha-glucosidase